MQYLVLAFDPQGRRVLTESATTAEAVARVEAYARSQGAVQALVYRYVLTHSLTDEASNESL